MENEISIQIRGSGGDQAAAEAKKAEVAIDQLGKQASQTDAALDSLAVSGGTSSVGGGGRSGKGGKGAAAVMKEIAEEAPKATRATGNFGAVAGQVGFQVQDFAVQVGAGQSALIAFAQQGSQLAGIFGPGGAVAGALLAVGAIAYNTFRNVSSGSAEMDDALADLQKNLDAVDRKSADAMASRDSAALASFADSLEAEAQGYARINEEIEKNISLTQARRRAQAEIESAQAALDLASIDADPSLSEEERIRRRAAVQGRLEQGRLRDRVAGIGDRVAQAQGDYETRRAAAKAASDATSDASFSAQSAREEREALAPRVAARRSLPGLRSDLEQAEERARKFREDGEIVDGRLRGDVKDNDKRLEELRRQIKDAEAQQASSEEIRRFRALDKVIPERDALAASRLEEEKKARAAAADAARRRDQVSAEAAEETAGAVNAFELGRQRREVGAGAQIRNQQEKERELRQEEERREREAAEAARRGVGRSGEGLADRAARAVAGSSERAARGLETLGDRLGSDPTAAGLEELAKALATVNQNFGQRDERLARTLRGIKQEVETLKAKLKAGGDGK